jgi:hypothetical protein
MRLSWPELLSDLSADGTAIALDMPGGGYDKLHAALERQNTLPPGKAGRTAVVAVVLAASRLLKQQLGPMGPVANFLNELGEDAVREEAKRILESAGRSSTERSLRGEPRTLLDSLWEMDATSRSTLLSQFRRLDDDGRRHMRAQMMRSTVRDLAMLAGLSHDDLTTALAMLTPPQQSKPGIADRIAVTLFPWMK